MLQYKWVRKLFENFQVHLLIIGVYIFLKVHITYFNAKKQLFGLFSQKSGTTCNSQSTWTNISNSFKQLPDSCRNSPIVPSVQICIPWRYISIYFLINSSLIVLSTSTSSQLFCLTVRVSTMMLGLDQAFSKIIALKILPITIAASTPLTTPITNVINVKKKSTSKKWESV